MRTLLRAGYLISLALFSMALIGCNTTPKPACTKTVSMLDSEPGRPYQILGQTKISKIGDDGLLRQDATMQALMRQSAASLGGDAIMNLHTNSKDLTGTVIAYKQILV